LKVNVHNQAPTPPKLTPKGLPPHARLRRSFPPQTSSLHSGTLEPERRVHPMRAQIAWHVCVIQHIVEGMQAHVCHATGAALRSIVACVVLDDTSPADGLCHWSIKLADVT